MLSLNEVRLLVDVRSAPGSRRMPHFARGALELSMPEHGIAYEHAPELGGLRKPRPNSTNKAWRNLGFRGYADYMQEDAFWLALAKVIHRSESVRTAIMCAEAVPWRCHRSLISDALTAQGVEVRHITSRSAPALHSITPFALVESGRISYPAADTLPM
jgi:uncharacterized protein (DUF488 family)